MENQNKSPWMSKTLWSALIVAAAAFYPPVGEFIRANPESYSIALGLLFAGLRMVTKGKVSIE